MSTKGLADRIDRLGAEIEDVGALLELLADEAARPARDDLDHATALRRELGHATRRLSDVSLVLKAAACRSRSEAADLARATGLEPR